MINRLNMKYTVELFLKMLLKFEIILNANWLLDYKKIIFS